MSIVAKLFWTWCVVLFVFGFWSKGKWFTWYAVLYIWYFAFSIKVNEDDYYSNEYYAKVGGISLDELNKLEEAILSLLEFNLFIDDELYDNYEKQLSGEVQI